MLKALLKSSNICHRRWERHRTMKNFCNSSRQIFSHTFPSLTRLPLVSLCTMWCVFHFSHNRTILRLTPGVQRALSRLVWKNLFQCIAHTSDEKIALISNGNFLMQFGVERENVCSFAIVAFTRTDLKIGAQRRFFLPIEKRTEKRTESAKNSNSSCPPLRFHCRHGGRKLWSGQW